MMFRFFVGLLMISLIAGCSTHQVGPPDDLLPIVATDDVRASSDLGWKVSMQWIDPDPHSPVLLISDYRFALAPATAPAPANRTTNSDNGHATKSVVSRARTVIKVETEAAKTLNDVLPTTSEISATGVIKTTPGADSDVEDDLEELLPAEGSVEIAVTPGGESRRSATTIRIVPMSEDDGMAASSGDTVAQPIVVFFDFDQDHLRHDTSVLLDTIPRNAVVDVIGFTCDLGHEDYNLDLSHRRAERVTAYLELRKVSVRLHEGKGECCPVSDDPAVNRRVEIDNTKK